MKNSVSWRLLLGSKIKTVLPKNPQNKQYTSLRVSCFITEEKESEILPEISSNLLMSLKIVKFYKLYNFFINLNVHIFKVAFFIHTRKESQSVIQNEKRQSNTIYVRNTSVTFRSTVFYLILKSNFISQT